MEEKSWSERDPRLPITIDLDWKAFELVNKWGEMLEDGEYSVEDIAAAGRYFATFKTEKKDK